MEGPAELFVETVTRVLAWADAHKAYLFLMAAVAACVIALNVAMDTWGLVELERLACAASAAPFIAAGVRADEGRVAEAVRLVEGALSKTPALVPGGGVSAEAERWVAGLRSGEVKTAVARIAEGLGRWLEAVKGGRYADYSSGRAVRICAGGVCAVKTRGWAVYFRPVKVEGAGGGKKEWIVARSPEELEAWLSRAGSAYVAPALFFEGGGVELRVVAVSEAVVDEVRRRLAAVRGASGVQYDALAASARRGVLTARAGDVARLWRAYMDGVESYLTDPARREELTREAERWIRALRLNAAAEKIVARGLEMLKALRDSGLFDVLRSMAQRLGEAGVESVEKMLKALEGGEFRLEAMPTGKAIRICGERCVSVDQRGVYTMALEGLSAEVRIPRLLPEEYAKRLHIGWLASDEFFDTRRGYTGMYTTQLWQLIAWLISKPGDLRLYALDVVLKTKGASVKLYAAASGVKLFAERSALSVKYSGQTSYRIPLGEQDVKASVIKLVLDYLDDGELLPLAVYYLGDGVVKKRLTISVSRERMHLFEGRRDARVYANHRVVDFRLAPEHYAKAVGELYFSGFGVLLDALHSHKWLFFKRLTARALSAVEMAGRRASVSLFRGGLMFAAYVESAEEYLRDLQRELGRYGIFARPRVYKTARGYIVRVVEEAAVEYARRNPEAREAVERMLLLNAAERPAEVLSFLSRHPDFATEAVRKALEVTGRATGPNSAVKRKIATARRKTRAELTKTGAETGPEAAMSTKAAGSRAAASVLNILPVKTVEGVTAMRLRIVKVKPGLPHSVAAVRTARTLEEAEELRRRLSLSGLNASVVSKGKDGFEVVVPQRELEKLSPEEKETIRRYLEQKMRENDEEREKAEEVLSRFNLGVKAVDVGGVRLGLVYKKRKGLRAEKYGDPKLIAEIKVVLESKLREMLGDEYEMWKDHIKIGEGGRRLVVKRQLLQRLAQRDPAIADALRQYEKYRT